MATLARALNRIVARLTSLSDTALLDSQVLLASIFKPFVRLGAGAPRMGTDERQQHKIEQAVGRLESGEPLPYVLGHWEFYGLDFEITPDTLIPRPETETAG